MGVYWIISQLLLFATVAALTVYYFIIQKVKKFKNAGIPYKTPLPVFGNSAPLLFRRKTAQEVFDELYYMEPEAKYVGYFDIMSQVIVVRDLELMKSVLVKNFDHFPNHNLLIKNNEEPLLSRNLFTLQDDRWRHVRNVLTPAFTSSKMKSMFNLMTDCAEDFTDSLAAISDGSEMDMKDVFTRYTNDVIATCAFGISINSMKNRDNEFYTVGKKSNFFESKAMLRMLFALMFPSLSKMLGVTVLGKRVENFFKDIIQTTMRVRDEKGIYRPDLIQLLMETRGKLGEGKELSIEDMTAQAYLFFFGGFESTSTCMCFTAHEIASRPNVYEKLQEEVDRVMEETGGKLTYEAVNKMEYLEAVINEALRLYPLTAGLDRKCSKPFELPPTLPGCKPFVIEKGMSIWIPSIVMHRDPKYFENPEQFNPDRFLDKEKNLVNHPAYTPFGVGPRMCIGNRFALLEIKILFCHLLSKCVLNVCDKTVLPMKFSKKTFALTADGGFWLSVSKRERQPADVQPRTCIDTRLVDPNFCKNRTVKDAENQ